MTKITKTISVQASPKKVIDYISKVGNHPAFISALKSIENINGDEKEIGTSWDWTFMMGGIELTGKSETINYKEGEVYAFKTFNGADSTFTYSVEPEGDSSRLTINVEYSMPETVFAKMADKAIVERLNEKEADSAADNLKAILES